MKGFRRAEPPNGASSSAVAAVLAVGAVTAAAVAAASAAASVSLARRVVTPSARPTDTDLVAVDTAAQTITLGRTADTELPGQYGLFTTGTLHHLKLGSILATTPETVTRKLLTRVGAETRLESRGTFSGWYFEAPDQLHLDYSHERIPTEIGECPAWLFDAQSDTWVIQVHGRGATRAECLRAVPVFHAAGVTSLLVSYRNDGDAPRSRSGTYSLGLTEWHDVEAAIAWARSRGAQRIIVMGWSMGGAIALQVALNSYHRDAIVGFILESPVVDWRRVLDFQARSMRVPSALADLAMRTLAVAWAAPLTGAEAPIVLDRLDVVARSGELTHPILILHSDDDGFVPSDGSHALHEARPDLVTMDTFTVARHTKLWNYDSARWNGDITGWMAKQLDAPASAAQPEK